MLPDTPYDDNNDEPLLPLCSRPKGGLAASRVYALTGMGGKKESLADFIQGSRAPSILKFYGWMLVQREVHTKDVLLHKHIVHIVGAGCPLCITDLEIVDNIFFGLPFARDFWDAMGLPLAASASVRLLHTLDVSAIVSDATPDVFIILCC